jgi:hypothetical protein
VSTFDPQMPSSFDREIQRAFELDQLKRERLRTREMSLAVQGQAWDLRIRQFACVAGFVLLLLALAGVLPIAPIRLLHLL